jgi:hypothetical protein
MSEAFTDIALLILALAVLTTWRHCSKTVKRAAPYTPPPPKRGIPYPGIPTVLTDALARAVDHGTIALPGPLSIAGADPDDLAQYTALVTRRVMAAAPSGSLVMTPTGIDNASVDVDALGNKSVNIVFLAHEANYSISIKLSAALVVKALGDIYIVNLKPYSAPVDATVTSIASASPYASYEPIVSPII